MGHGSGVKRGGIGCVMLALVLMGSVAAWIPAATAGQAPATAGEPKRSYGSIDVIMYQTSW